MAKTLVIGCDTPEQARQQMIKFSADYTMIEVGPTSDIRVATVGAGWSTAKFLVIGTADAISGPFPPAAGPVAGPPAKGG